ncbi:MAG: hypothetical protein ACYDA4_04610 [Ignavibacteriaceae bacterium]
MGITIHYSGKAKSLEAIEQFIDTLQEISEESGWSYHLVSGSVKGRFKPFWGIGYGFKPSEDQILKGGIEFFPRMVSSRCNGYFKIYDTKFAAPVKKSFEKGVWPSFTIDTHKKGIQLTLHPKCETLSFIFDLQTLELASYEVYAHSRGIIYGFNGFSCKTQFAGFDVHRIVCKLIKMASRYIDYTKVYDESNYYGTEDSQASQENFELVDNALKMFLEVLKNKGLHVTSGDEL